MRPAHAERASPGDRHAEPARLEAAGGVLALVLGQEVPQAQVRGEPRQREERGAPLAQRHRLLAGVERQQLAEPVHPGRPLPEGVLGDGGRDAGQIVADREHLAAADADGKDTAGGMVVPADGAFDVGHEHGADGPSACPSRPGGPRRPSRRAGSALPRSARTPSSSLRGRRSSSAGSTRR